MLVGISLDGVDGLRDRDLAALDLGENEADLVDHAGEERLVLPARPEIAEHRRLRAEVGGDGGIVGGAAVADQPESEGVEMLLVERRGSPPRPSPGLPTHWPAR